MSDSFETAVNEAITKMTQNDDGTWALPEELPAEVKFAATLEKRRRDTQAAFSKATQRVKALEVENTELAKGWEQDITKGLTEEERNELDELKHEDPDAWRVKLNELEQNKKADFSSRREEISKKAVQESEAERRTRLLEEFAEANPDIALTDQVIEDEIPPKYTKALANGDVSFEEFLDNCKTYLSKGKVLASGEEAPATPDLTKAGGSATPSPTAVEQEIKDSYKNETY